MIGSPHLTTYVGTLAINYSCLLGGVAIILTKHSGATLPSDGVYFTRDVFFEKRAQVNRHLYYYNNCNFYCRSQNTGHLSPTVEVFRISAFSVSPFIFHCFGYIYIYHYITFKKVFGVAN